MRRTPARRGACTRCCWPVCTAPGTSSRRIRWAATAIATIWFYDLHLLAATFCAADWDEFLAQTEAKDLREVCLEGLTMARDCFGTVLPDTVWVALARPGRRQTVARYMDSPALTRIWLDFRAIDDARGKAHFIRETLFPAASYMRGKYPDGGWLPWLYCRRAFGGVRRRLNR